jgi:hypothetical protein
MGIEAATGLTRATNATSESRTCCAVVSEKSPTSIP